MKKIILFTFSILFLGFSLGQQTLSISDAVSQQYRKFYPEHLIDFSWVPNSTLYSVIEGYIVIGIYNSEGVEQKQISLDQLNQAMSAAFPYVAHIDWKNENEFYLTDGKSYFLYNWKENKGERVAKPQQAFQNQELNIASGKVAHTFENNLLITNSNSTINVTDYRDPNIVSGQAIARSEFGITNGIFWSVSGDKLAFYQKNESNVSDYPLLDISETPGKLNSIKYPMAGQGSEKAKVGIYDLTSKEVVYLDCKYGEEHYYTNLSWTPDEKKILKGYYDVRILKFVDLGKNFRNVSCLCNFRREFTWDSK